MSEQGQFVGNKNTGIDVLAEFQLAELSTKQKSSPDFGVKISRKIWGFINTGLGGYFYNRNAQFIKNRSYANGIIDVQTMFQDRFQFNAKQNYIRLDWQTLQIVNRIISGLIGRWMQRGEKVSVTAMDDRSIKNKEAQYDQLEFIIENRRQLEELEQKTGVEFIPKGIEIPADKDELKLWKAQFQRLPEEIETEMGCNDVLQSNGLFDVVKEKLLHDSAEVGFVGTYTWSDEQGIIHTRWVKPEDSIYGWSEYPDFRDASFLGEAPSMKISELRREFGKEFHPNDPLALTEEQLFSIAKTAKEWQYNTNLSWTNTWNTIFLRPYDEWNVRSVRFELRTVDSEPYTITKSTISDRTYAQKGYPVNKKGQQKDKPSPNQRVVDDTNINIYEAVYLPDNDILLRWRLKSNMIRPQDPREIGNAEFSYSFYMYQNYMLRNLAVPQKIQAAVDGMILALLKMQQVVARMRPTGAAIDESALQNIDYGLGDTQNKTVDYKRLYDQTGDIYYRGVDAEGNRVPVPIQELANSGFLGQMQGLIQNYQFNYQTLKDELGEDPNMITAALQPRVTAQNVEASQINAEFATDYMYRAYAECMKMTAKKVSCLLKDSVMYGSKAYRSIVKQDYTTWQIFNADIKFLPTQQDVVRFEAMMNESIAANPDILLFINPFLLMQMAKEDVKLAWMMFDNGRKKMLLHRMEETRQNQEATFKAQVESGKVAEQERRETEKEKGSWAVEKEKAAGETMNKNAVVAMVTSLLSKGEAIPSNLQPVVDVVMENILIPLATQNEQQKAEMIERYKQATQGNEQEVSQGTMEQEQMEQEPINNQPQVAA